MSVPLSGDFAPATASADARLLREWVVLAVLFALVAGWLAFLAWATVALAGRLI